MTKLVIATFGLVLVFVACAGADSDTSDPVASDEFCAAASDFVTESGAPSPTDVNSQRLMLENILASSRDLAEAAPATIKQDAETITKTVPKIMEVLDEVDYDVARLSPEQQHELENNPEFSRAFGSLMTFMTQNCPEVRAAFSSTTGSDSP